MAKERPEPKQTRKKQQFQGGFECIFVEDPPEQLQTECPICLCVLCDPYLVDCCGYSFCRFCIERVKTENKLCPLCNVQFTNFMPNKRLQRVLNEMRVYCSNREAGCKWFGELSKLPQHLDPEPASDSDQLAGCPFVTLKCHLCGAGVRRQDIEEHETGICPQRPCMCSLCNEYKSTYEDVTSNHWLVCPARPICCPNVCGIQPKLQHLKEHLKNDCCNAVVECSFSYAGCEAELPRKEMQAHIAENLTKHMSLQAENHQRQLEAFSNQLEQLNTQIYELNAEKQAMLEKFQEEAKRNQTELKKSNAKIKALEEKLGAQEHQNALVDPERKLTKDFSELKHEVRAHQLQIETLHHHIGIVPMQFTVDNYRRLLRLRRSWDSRPFYSHPEGYKMKLTVYVTGCGIGRDTHVSVFAYLMAGEFDNDLKWPFRGCIIIELVDPEERYNNCVCLVSFEKNQQDRIPPGGEDKGLGHPRFISKCDVETKFLRNNRLHFKISSIDL